MKNLPYSDNTRIGKCCGCGACAQRCPQECIRMRENPEGFLYPVVDTLACSGCGACERVCPALHRAAAQRPQEIYAVKSRDETVRLAGSSGGVFSLLAEQTIQTGGVVFGAAFTPEWEVAHRGSETRTEIAPLTGSKYLQSRIGTCYAQVRRLLAEGRKVLFTGTPCQIAGLYGFLGSRKAENLLTAECLCHGVPSPKVWRRFLREAGNGSLVRQVQFRDKAAGWKNYGVRIDTAAGTIRIPHRECSFMRGFLADLYLRPSCYACRFKAGRSGSDIALGDFWGVGKALPEFDDDKGVSLILVNTPKGAEAFAALDAESVPVGYRAAKVRNGGVTKSAPRHPRRKDFFRRLDTADDVSQLIDRHIALTPTQRLVRKLRRAIHL